MSSTGGTRRLLDPRLRILIENNVAKNHRSFIVLVGDRGRDRVGFTFLLKLNDQLNHDSIDTRSLLSSFSCPKQVKLEATCAMVL
jgi:hypothetical protein